MQTQWQKWKGIFSALRAGILFIPIWTAFAVQEPKNDPLPLDDLRIFTAIFGTIKQSYVEKVTDKKLIEGALKGMVAGLDPHSSYLDRQAYQELMDETQGEFGGIGVEIIAGDGLIKVVSPIEDTPAYKAGIKNGDLIVKIDEAQVQGMSATDAVSKMRGKPNTSVTLTVVRKSEPKPLTLTLYRAIIKVQSVKSRILEPNYGYIRVTQFQEHTTQNVVAAIHSLMKENKNTPLKGLIIDLRNNPGGIIQAAVGVPTIFLPKGALIVYTEGRNEIAKNQFYALPKFYMLPSLGRKTKTVEEYEKTVEINDPLKHLPMWVKEVPIVVLVNSGSASSAEIVAGALQDYRRALIVGTQTFGKGSIQTVIPIDGGQAGLRLTTARYFTPNGRSIQAKGIVPDIVVEDAIINKESINNPLQIREADLENHLDNLTSKDKDQNGAPGLFDAKESADARIRNFISRDYQLQQGLSVLKVQFLLFEQKLMQDFKKLPSHSFMDSTTGKVFKRRLKTLPVGG